MSLQIAILKVLAGLPKGRTSLAILKQYVAVLSCSGAEWSQRMKRLAALEPELDIFSSGYVLREPSEWRITDDGREFLALIEAAFAEKMVSSAIALPVVSDPDRRPPNVIQISGHRVQRGGGATPPDAS